VLYELPQRLFLFYHVCWRPLQFWSFGFLFWIFEIKQYNKHKRIYGHTLYPTLLFSIISVAIDNCEYIFYTRSVVWLTPPRWSSSIVRWQWFAHWDGRGVVTWTMCLSYSLGSTTRPVTWMHVLSCSAFIQRRGVVSWVPAEVSRFSNNWESLPWPRGGWVLCSPGSLNVASSYRPCKATW